MPALSKIPQDLFDLNSKLAPIFLFIKKDFDHADQFKKIYITPY